MTAVGALPPPDVLCVGHASYDLVFSLPHHPYPDEKLFATGLTRCGGGPAANAAVAVARLGFRAAFAGYLGRDAFGDAHVAELMSEGVDLTGLVRGSDPTPLSAILVKPDGARALVTHKGATRPLPDPGQEFMPALGRVLLMDGHEPELSMRLARQAAAQGVPTVLDAGSLHDGTERLMTCVDHLVASAKFACQVAGTEDPERALDLLSGLAPTVVITLGENGGVWKTPEGVRGRYRAFPIRVRDTTGAGDAFHGAYAAALSQGMNWHETLRLARAVAALCCAGIGARPALPHRREVDDFLRAMDEEP